MGTAHVLEAVRAMNAPCVVVVVTSDKCYENREEMHAYREDEAMGGHDPYSMSKGATELVVSAWRRSFFDASATSGRSPMVRVASARAGNVLGGGDWAQDRIVPDLVRGALVGEPVLLRRPASVRPWQHVLEPLSGYLLLGARLLRDESNAHPTLRSGFNFGPRIADAVEVRVLAKALYAHLPAGRAVEAENVVGPHEAHLLMLDTRRAKAELDWEPRWSLDVACEATAAWYLAAHRGADARELSALTRSQIDAYERA